MGRAGKQVIREGSDEDDIPLAQRKRKVGTSAQRPRGRGRTNRSAAPRQGHCACTKQAHELDDHYDDYEDISLNTLANFVLRPSHPPRSATQMGIFKMVEYNSGSHDVYKERYLNPALWQKEFDADIRFWLKFNTDWYESIILYKEHMTVDMKSIKWDTLRSFNISAVNEAIDICHAKGMTSIMAMNYDWNEEVVAQFYANLYVWCETKTFHWLLQGKPLSISYERFTQILGFGEEDLGLPKLHGGEIPLDSEMAFMYDAAFGKVEFGTTHGMKPVYRMLNQLFRYTLTSKIGDNYNISNIAKDILVRMVPGKEKFSVFDFIWEEIIVCSLSANKSCQYAPWIFKMICELTEVDILTDKTHTWYKPNKGNIERLLKLDKHAPTRATFSGGPSSGGPSFYEPPYSSRGPSSSRGTIPPSKKKSIFNFLSKGLFAYFNVGKHNAQDIRAHRQHVDEQLLKLETRYKSMLAQHNIEHSPVREPMDFPPPPVFYNPWEVYGDTSMMYGAPLVDIDDEDFGGGETKEDDSPPEAHSPHGSDD
jgi:hypothetical protein